MAFSATYFACDAGGSPGRRLYRYDTTDHPDTVEAAGYFDNVDDDQQLAIGDRIDVVQWSDTPFSAGATISRAGQFIVTNVISRTAASNAGDVNVAQVFLSTGLLSSGT